MAQQSASTSSDVSKAFLATKTPDHPAPVLPNPDLLPLAKYLENTVTLLLHAFNAGDPQFLRSALERYFAPIIQVSDPSTNTQVTTNPEEYAAYITASRRQTPFHNLELFNYTVLVDDVKGPAKVFTTNRVLGSHNENLDLTRESVIVFHFECHASEEWLCVAVDIIRGPGHGLLS